MNKKAISPLIATFILISLTVAVGAMIVAWGKNYVEKQIGCLKLGASLSLISTDFKKDIWQIELYLTNTGETTIKSNEIYFRVISEGGVSDICQNIQGGCSFSLNLNEVLSGETAKVEIYMSNASYVYGKNIKSLELYHRQCNMLLSSINI